MLSQSSPRKWNKMMQKSTTFTTILRVKKCHFHYDMQIITDHNCNKNFETIANKLKQGHYKNFAD
jgi:hypothetical protein